MKIKKTAYSTLKIALKSVGYFLLFIFTYLTFAYVLSRIPVKENALNEVKNIDIYLLSNGVHTDIVLPLKNEIHDWSKFVLYKNIRQNDSTFNFVAFGWGDKGFYLETPTWAELKVSTAFNASFGLSTSAIHTTFYTKMQENSTNCVKISISKNQYKKLIHYMKESFSMNKKNELLFIPTKYVYGNHDAFYEAKGNYNLFQTCNTWTNNALKSCDQKASFWTPFQGGMFRHYQ